MDFEAFVASNFEGCVTEFAPRKALKSIARCMLTLDEAAALIPSYDKTDQVSVRTVSGRARLGREQKSSM